MLTIYLAATTGLTLTGFLLLKIVEIKNWYQEQELKKQLSLEIAKKRECGAKEKLLRVKSILQRMKQEFSIISSTIQWIDGLSPVDFQNRYQDLWDKTAEAQMLLAFYAPTLKESAENLDNLLSDYWSKLYSVLVGEKVERTTLNYLEVVEYSRMIPAQIQDIRKKIGEMTSTVLCQ